MKANARVTWLLLLSGCLTLAWGQRAGGEERARYGDVLAYSLTSYEPVPVREDYSSGLFAAGTSLLSLAEEISANERRTLRELLKSYLSESLSVREPLLVLLRKKDSSRDYRGPGTRLLSGYGEVFGKDTVGRPRMNGAGLEEPNAVYLKMTVGF